MGEETSDYMEVLAKYRSSSGIKVYLIYNYEDEQFIMFKSVYNTPNANFEASLIAFDEYKISFPLIYGKNDRFDIQIEDDPWHSGLFIWVSDANSDTDFINHARLLSYTRTEVTIDSKSVLKVIRVIDKIGALPLFYATIEFFLRTLKIISYALDTLDEQKKSRIYNKIQEIDREICKDYGEECYFKKEYFEKHIGYIVWILPILRNSFRKLRKIILRYRRRHK